MRMATGGWPPPADRNGFFYLLNREDGAFVDAMPFVEEISWASGIGEDGRPIYNPDNRPGNPADFGRWRTW